MPRSARLPIAVLAIACAVPPSSAMADTGGISAPGRPAVEAVGCSTSQNRWRGAELQITGESLQTVTAVRFLGSRGKRDDRVARPAAADEGQATSQSRAGNYVVIQTASGASYAYMHMTAAALVEKGDRVRAGQRLGDVGSTGRSSACHLHFEWWTAPGWYRGGKAIDPLSILKRWERQ